MTMFVMSQSFISLPSFMFVSAAVSEIHDLNQNKKKNNFENAYFQFNTFPGHITNPFLNQSYLSYLHTKLARSLVYHKPKDNWNFLKYTHNASKPGPCIPIYTVHRTV